MMIIVESVLLAHGSPANGSAKHIASLLVFLVRHKVLFDLIVSHHFKLSIVVASFHGAHGLFPLIRGDWSRHESLVILAAAIINGVKNSASVTNIIEVEPDVEEDPTKGQYAKVHHKPEVTVLLFCLQAG